MIELGYSSRTIQPYLDVGLIETTWADGTKAIGTCSLVGRNDILTAGHCVYNPDKGGWAESFQFYFGTDFNISTGSFENIIYNPSYSQWKALAWPSNAFVDGNNTFFLSSESQYDIALIGIDKPIGDTLGWLGLDPGYNSAATADAIGYPEGSSGMMLQTVSVTKNATYQTYESSYGGFGPGSSGGPLLVGNFVIGVKSTTSSWADISSVYDVLVDELTANDTLMGVLADNVKPTISLSTSDGFLYAGETAEISFTLSETSSNFTASDVTVSGGTLSNFSGEGMNYSATFIPSRNSTVNGVISVASGTFSDVAGNLNGDGADANNRLTIPTNTLLLNGTDLSQNDQLTGGYGLSIDGGAGIDTVMYSLPRDAYAIEKTALGDTVHALGGSGTADSLRNVERLHFADLSLALDAAGNALETLQFIGVVAPSLIDNLAVRGVILKFFDQGYSLDQFSQYALDIGLVARDNTLLAHTIFQNVLNKTPTPDVTDALVSYIEQHGQANFIATVAAMNLNVDLVGLQKDGMEFI